MWASSPALLPSGFGLCSVLSKNGALGTEARRKQRNCLYEGAEHATGPQEIWVSLPLN